MRIAVEIPYYAHGTRGTTQYGENLIRALGAASTEDEFLAFNYFYGDYEGRLARLSSRLAAPNVELAVPRWPQRLVDFAERRLGYPFADRHFIAPRGVEVFHDGGLHPVDTRRTASIVTIHGVWLVSDAMGESFAREVLPQVLRASWVIANSRCTRDMLLKHYPVDPARLSVVYYGVDHSKFRPIEDRRILEAAAAKYRLPERFLLCVGPFQLRDNVELALLALQRNRGRAPYRGLKLVLAGGLEEHGAALVARVRQMGLEDLVHFAGYVPHEDLGAVYALAEACVHASLYEEFGAQLLEACASGAPLVASRIGGIEESAGDAPAYFNPHQVEDFEAALSRVLESPSLRAERREKGLLWSRRFSWELAARQTLEIYRAAAGRLSR